jgi:hypothetical protein
MCVTTSVCARADASKTRRATTATSALRTRARMQRAVACSSRSLVVRPMRHRRHQPTAWQIVRFDSIFVWRRAGRATRPTCVCSRSVCEPSTAVLLRAQMVCRLAWFRWATMALARAMPRFGPTPQWYSSCRHRGKRQSSQVSVSGVKNGTLLAVWAAILCRSAPTSMRRSTRLTRATARER